MLALSVPAAAGTTWNPADNSNGTLSNGNLTVAFQTTAGSWKSIRSTTSKSSGKWHFECTCVNQDNSGGWMLGLANSTGSLNNYAGSDTNSVCYQFANNIPGINQYNNGAVQGSWTHTIVNGNVLAIEVDIGGKKMWCKNLTQATGWTFQNIGGNFTGDPAAGTGGAPFASSMSTGIFVMVSGLFVSSVADTFTLNTGPSFVGTVSSGFSAWG